MGKLSDTINEKPAILLSEDYNTLIESHLAYFKADPQARITTVEPNQAHVYEGDFYGLLYFLAVPSKYHYAIMRVNNMWSSADYDGELQAIFIPSIERMDRAVTHFKSVET